MYPLTRVDGDGQTLDGSKNNYTLTFPPGQQPPVNAFWSLTMYDGKTQLLIENPINRYLINSPMLPAMKTNADGSLTLYIQNKSPGADKEANWLPAPERPDLPGDAALLAEDRSALDPAGGRRHLEAAGDRGGEVAFTAAAVAAKDGGHGLREPVRSMRAECRRRLQQLWTRVVFAMPVEVNSRRLSRDLAQQSRRIFDLDRFAERWLTTRHSIYVNLGLIAVISRVLGSKQMAHNIPKRNSNRRRTCRGIGVAVLLFGSMSEAAYADESGVSYWLPGRFSSLAATPQVPGWSMAAVYYHTSVEASGAVAAAKQIQIGRFPATVNVNLNASLNAQADLVLLNPTYTFGTPVLGGQLVDRHHRPVRSSQHRH